jgi:hypothetical protein
MQPSRCHQVPKYHPFKNREGLHIVMEWEHVSKHEVLNLYEEVSVK